jgi:hypothetical protein
LEKCGYCQKKIHQPDEIPDLLTIYRFVTKHPALPAEADFHALTRTGHDLNLDTMLNEAVMPPPPASTGLAMVQGK